MKRLLSFICIFCLLFAAAGCGSDMVVNGKERKTIGCINLVVNDSSIMEQKAADVQYKVIWGNIVWAVILSGTVIMPIYFIGFSMFEPVGSK